MANFAFYGGISLDFGAQVAEKNPSHFMVNEEVGRSGQG